MAAYFITNFTNGVFSIFQMSSLRHALRVMQCSDVSQHDWHGGQILCNLRPSLPSSSPALAHAVLIDFSATLQTLDLDVNLAKDDYGRCVSAITHENTTGLDSKWVTEYWDRDEMKRENWDAYDMCMMKNGYYWFSKREDPYAFVYEGH